MANPPRSTNERAETIKATIAKLIEEMYQDFDGTHVTATKQDIANIYKALLLAFETIHESNLEASASGTDRQEATRRYLDSMGRFIDAIKQGMSDLIMVGKR